MNEIKIEYQSNLEKDKYKVNNNKSQSIINDKKDPKTLHFKKDLIINDAYSSLADNTSLIIKTLDDLFLIIYPTKDRTLICYDIINNKKVNEVRNAHDNPITGLRYYPDAYNKMNLMLTLSSNYNHIKIWNLGNFQCLLDFEKINESGWINSACFLNDNNQIYFLSSNAIGFSKRPAPIRVYDLKGKLIKEIEDSNINTYFIDYYYDNKSSKNYIITCNTCFCRSYDYNNNKIYNVYNDQANSFHISATVNILGDKTNLIESCQDGKIRIWDFHSGKILHKIIVSNNSSLYGICLWNDDYLMVGSENESIKIIDLNEKKEIASLNSYKNKVTMIRKLFHPKLGEFLVSQNHSNGFKLWY